MNSVLSVLFNDLHLLGVDLDLVLLFAFLDRSLDVWGVDFFTGHMHDRDARLSFFHLLVESLKLLTVGILSLRDLHHLLLWLYLLNGSLRPKLNLGHHRVEIYTRLELLLRLVRSQVTSSCTPTAKQKLPLTLGTSSQAQHLFALLFKV